MEKQIQVQEILAILHKWGIHTLGQLAALDKEQLGARLGPEAVRMWERANGQSNRVLKLIDRRSRSKENFEFEHEIETAQPLLFMLRRFLEQLAVRLSAIYLVAKELTLRITFSKSRQDEPPVAGKQVYERVFKIPQPTNDVDLLFRMLQTHLENFRSKHPILAVALSAEPIKPAREQFGLFETILRNPQQLSETLARLTALLGADRVGTPVLEETHRPDAFRMASSRSVAQASKLWGTQAPPPAKETAGKMPACPTAEMAVLRCARRYGDFGPQSLPLSCAMKINRHTCAARKFREKSSSNAAHICFRELGGAKNRGHAPSGRSNCKVVNWFGVTNRTRHAKLRRGTRNLEGGWHL